MDNVAFVAQMKGMSLQQEAEITPDHALFSWMEDYDTVLTIKGGNSKNGTPMVHSDYNLFSKRHLTGKDASNIRSIPVNKPPELPVIVFAYPTKEFIPYRPKEPRVSRPQRWM